MTIGKRPRQWILGGRVGITHAKHKHCPVEEDLIGRTKEPTMIKNWRIWLTYTALVSLIIVAMSFISRTTLVLEDSRQATQLNALKTRLQADNQKQVSSAARRVDRYLAGLVAIESLRSPWDYIEAPDLSEVGSDTSTTTNWVENAYAQFYFQLSQQGRLRVLSKDPNLSLENFDRLIKAFKWQRQLPGLLDATTVGWAADPTEIYRVNWLINQRKGPGDATQFSTDILLPDGDFQPIPAVIDASNPGDSPQVNDDLSKNNTDPNRLIGQDLPTQSPNQAPQADPSSDESSTAAPTNSTTTKPLAFLRLNAISVGPIYPVWLSGELFFVRQVSVDGDAYLQGCWLNWNRLKNRLSREIRLDLPAQTQIVPVETLPKSIDEVGYANWAPLHIIPPPITIPVKDFPSDGGWLILIFGWVFLTVACVAVGMLVHAVLKLSERRESFVSAVTHELRTPLTTFRLYADLLAKSPEPEKTAIYAKTLQTESERLSHLIENVLCYSRMEKRGITSHHRVTSIGTLVDSIVPRLEDHCFRADMILDFADATPQVRRLDLLTDPSAVERILFNLVDNACKYGKTDSERVIELKIVRQDKRLQFDVRDHGPGMSVSQKRKMFQAYNHGQISAGSPNTTIGLGLNICYNLAKALGGQLTFHDQSPGCMFRLEIPVDAT